MLEISLRKTINVLHQRLTLSVGLCCFAAKMFANQMKVEALEQVVAEVGLEEFDVSLYHFAAEEEMIMKLKDSRLLQAVRYMQEEQGRLAR